MVLLFKEAYIDLTMCAVLQHYSIKRNPELNFYDTLPDAISSILAYFTLSTLVYCLPFYILFRAAYDYKRIQTQRFEEKFALKKQQNTSMIKGLFCVFWEDQRKDDFLSLIYMFIFYERRLLSIWIVVYYQEHVYFQVVPLVAMSVANMMYIIGRRPFIQTNEVELVSEMLIYVTLLIFLLYTDTSMDYNRRF